MQVWDIFSGIQDAHKTGYVQEKNELAPNNSGNSLISASLYRDSSIGRAL